MLLSQGTVSSAIMTECSWSDQRTRSGWSRVTAMWAGKHGDDLGQQSFSRAPILENSEYLVPPQAVCCVFLLLLQTGSLGPRPLGFEPCITFVLHQQSSSGLLCHRVYFDSEAAQLDRICSRVLRSLHWLHWAESAAFHFTKLTGVWRRSYIDLGIILILDGCSPVKFVQKDFAGNWHAYSDLLLHVTLGNQALPASLLAHGLPMRLIPPKSSAILLDMSY